MVKSGKVVYKSRAVRCCRDRPGCLLQASFLLLCRMSKEGEVGRRGQLLDGFLEDCANVVRVETVTGGIVVESDEFLPHGYLL